MEPAIEPTKPNEPPITEIPIGDDDSDFVPISAPAGNPGETVQPPDPGVIPEPPKTGRHPKGCKCGRCIQSGGTGGYEKGGAKRRTPGTGAVPSFADVLSQPESPSGPDYSQLAGMTFDMSVGMATMIFGPEWQPRSPDEKAVVVAPLAAYMKSKGMSDLPPGMVLSLVCIAYAAPRLQAPTTKQKVVGIWLWIKSKFGRKHKTP